jgi:hypothetical protein
MDTQGEFVRAQVARRLGRLARHRCPREFGHRKAGAQFQITGAPEGWTAQNVLWVPEPTSSHQPRQSSIRHKLASADARRERRVRGCQSVSHAAARAPGLLGAPTPANVHLRVNGFIWCLPIPGPVFVLAATRRFYSKIGWAAARSFESTGPGIAGCQLAIEPRSWFDSEVALSISPREDPKVGTHRALATRTCRRLGGPRRVAMVDAGSPARSRSLDEDRLETSLPSVGAQAQEIDATRQP